MAGALSLLLTFSVVGCEPVPAPPPQAVEQAKVDVERSTFTVTRTEVMTDPEVSSVGVVRVVDTNGETVMGAQVTIVGRFDSTSNTQSFAVKPTDESGRTAFAMTAKELLTVTLEAHVRLGGSEVVLGQKPVLRFVAGPPRTLTFTKGPSTATAGVPVNSPFSPVSVSAVDAFGHPVEKPYRVFLALAPGSGASRLEGNLVVPLAQGVAVFPDIRILGSGSAALVASATGAPSITSNSFTVYVGPESALRFDTPFPASVLAGVPLTSGITLAVTDAYGNPRSLSSSNVCQKVQLSVEHDGESSPLAVVSSSGLYGGPMTLPPVRVVHPGAEVRLVAHCPGLQDAVSTPFSVLAGPPDAAMSSLRATPERLVAGGTARALLRVQLLDAGGNPVVDAPVQLSVPGSGAVLAPAGGAGRTDARGGFSATLASTQPGTVRVSAMSGGLELKTDVSFGPACSATSALPLLPVAGADILGDSQAADSSLIPVDLNRDGHLDAVSQDGRIYDNAGDGTLVLRDQDWERMPGPLAVGDLDGDGAPDVLSAGDPVSVRFNRGDGSLFPPQPLVWASGAAKRAWVVDVNGDGLRDVAYTGSGFSSAAGMHVLLNRGGGVFSPEVSSPLLADADDAVVLVPGGPREGADAALVVHPQTAIHVFHAGADGRFVEVAGVTPWDMPKGLLQADVDGDGRDDLIVRYYGGVQRLTLLRHAGPGRFASPVEVSTGADVGTVAVADVDGDGGRDIVLTSVNEAPARLMLVLRDAAGGVVPARQLPLRVDPVSVSAADLTGDGRPEVLVSSKAGVLPLLNRGDGTFPAAPPRLGFSGNFLVRGDFNGDGVMDAGGFAEGGGSLRVSQPDGSRAVWSVPLSGVNASAAAVADLDGDGLSDLVVLGTFDSRVYVLHNAGDGTFTRGTLTLSAAVRTLAVGDLDGDGARDVVVTLPSLAQALVLHNDGTGTLTPGAVIPMGPGPHALAIAELNGDGHLDLVVAHTGDGSVRRFLNDGSGGLTLQTTVKTGTLPVALAASDLDGDGLAEVMVAHQEGTVAVLPGAGGPPRVYAVGSAPADMVLGDFNGDGHLDIALAENNLRVGLLLGQEGGGFSRHQGQEALQFVHALLALDWEGDGRTELLAAGGYFVELLSPTCVR